MIWDLVEEALHLGAAALAERATANPHWFAAAVVDRSRRYTSEREALHRPADRQADLAARALFFSVVDAAKPLVPLVELVRRGGLGGVHAGPAAPVASELPVQRVIDLGAGCGAMSLGLLAAAATHGWRARWELLLIDRDAEALAIGERAVRHLAAALGQEVTVRSVTSELTSWRPAVSERGQALVLAGTVLNELTVSAARQLVATALAQLAPHGAVLLMEPALRDAARRLHTLRDEHLAAGSARVLAPCTHARTPCPMLARDTDWCHEDRPWAAPRRLRAVADVTRLRDGNLKYAYLLLAPPHAPATPPLWAVPPGHLALRVVSGALPGKGRKEVFACGEVGRVLVRRLDRRASVATEWFDELRRGDLLAAPQDRVAQVAAAGRLEVTAEDAWPVLHVAPLRASEDLGRAPGTDETEDDDG